MKFEDFLKTNLEFHEIKLVEYINNSINFGFDVKFIILFKFNYFKISFFIESNCSY